MLCGNDDYFYKMLIIIIIVISHVEICSKPMAILLYDDFRVCVFALFVLACHSGFLEGFLFFYDDS